MDEPCPRKIEIAFPDPLPIGEEELALIEAHMGAIIAAMIELDPADESRAA